MGEPFIFKKIDSPELLEEAYRLRFQVYCRECNFISETECPEGYETDEFDRYAVHFGAFDINGQIVGAVRLILPVCEQFPIEKLCPELNINRSLIKRQETAEISRLSISKLYRRRVLSDFYCEPQTEEKPAHFIRRVSSIAMGLCNALYEECRQSGIDYCFALMEEPLCLLLKLRGFVFEPIGPPVDLYGMVTPHLIDVQKNGGKGLFRSSLHYPFMH